MIKKFLLALIFTLFIVNCQRDIISSTKSYEETKNCLLEHCTPFMESCTNENLCGKIVEECKF